MKVPPCRWAHISPYISHAVLHSTKRRLSICTQCYRNFLSSSHLEGRAISAVPVIESRIMMSVCHVGIYGIR